MRLLLMYYIPLMNAVLFRGFWLWKLFYRVIRRLRTDIHPFKVKIVLLRLRKRLNLALSVIFLMFATIFWKELTKHVLSNRKHQNTGCFFYEFTTLILYYSKKFNFVFYQLLRNFRTFSVPSGKPCLLKCVRTYQSKLLGMHKTINRSICMEK